MADKLLPLKFNKGVANRAHETKTPEGFARAASDVDISADGVTSRRDGYTRVAPLVGARSVWSDPQISFALAAGGSTLYRMDNSNVLTALKTGLSGADVHYVMTPLGVYWSDGTICGRVDVMGNYGAWGVETPAVVTAIATSTGQLDPGIYNVSSTFVDPLGQEGGAPSSTQVTLTAPGGIAITTSAPLNTAITEARNYVTTANGGELQYAGSITPGSTFNVDTSPRGRPLRTENLMPLPPLLYPAVKHGRLFGASGRFIFWSEPMYYGLYNPQKNFTTLRGQNITMIGVADTPGFLVYIGTDVRTYKWEGDSIENASMSVISQTGVIPGSMARVSPDAVKLQGVDTWVPVWIDKRGVPYAGTNGTQTQLHDQFAYPLFNSAAAVFDQRNGNSRYLVSGRGGAPSPLAFGDYVTSTSYNAGGGP